jgi:hypothetical protein
MMSENDRSQRHAKLRSTLRRGDPAGAENGLAAEETQAMRRAVLTALGEPRRRLFAPAIATASVLALSFAVALTLWRGQASPPLPRAPSAPSVPVESAAASGPSPAQPQARARAQIAERSPARSARRLAAIPGSSGTSSARAPVPAPPHPSAPDRPVEEAKPEVKPEETPTRQVEFATAGGTRIIWMLPETTR